MGELGCGANLARGFLVALNILFMLLGLTLFGAGLFFKFGTEINNDLDVESLLSQVDASAVLGGQDLYTLLNAFSVAMIVAGVIIAVIAGLGCCGACCKVSGLLVFYAVWILLFLIAEIVGLALFFTMRSLIDGILTEGLKKVAEKYDINASNKDKSSLTDDEILSQALDGLFIEYRCCGVTNSSDLPSFPPSCCNNSTRFENGTISVPDSTCMTNPTETNSYANKGCYQALWDLINEYSNAAIGIGVAILVVEILCVVFSFILCRTVNELNKVDSM